MVGAILLLETDRITAPVPVHGLARNSRLATALTLRIYICGKVPLDRVVMEINSYHCLNGSAKVHAKEIYMLEVAISVGGGFTVKDFPFIIALNGRVGISCLKRSSQA